MGVPAPDAVRLRASGDSMEPLIWHGDVLPADPSGIRPKLRAPGDVSLREGQEDDIPVIGLDGDLIVKAVRRPAEDRPILVSEDAALDRLCRIPARRRARQSPFKPLFMGLSGFPPHNLALRTAVKAPFPASRGVP